MLQVISPPPENAAALTAKCFIYSSGAATTAPTPQATQTHAGALTDAPRHNNSHPLTRNQTPTQNTC
eukprot:481818-Rhodomonas_salina.1